MSDGTREESVWPSVGRSRWGFRLPQIIGTPPALPLLPFRVATNPSPRELGLACEHSRSASAVFLFSFGDKAASHRVNNAFNAFCELYLQCQLARRDRLHSLSLEREKLFSVTYIRDKMVCTWSPEHIFAVQKADFIDRAEGVVEEVLAAVSVDRAKQFVRLGASMIREDLRFTRLKEPELA